MFCIYGGFACMHICAPYTHGSQKRVPGSPGTVVRRAVKHHVGAGNWMAILWQSSQCSVSCLSRPALNFYLLIYWVREEELMCYTMCGGQCVELFLFFYHEGPRDQTQVVKQDSKHLYPPSHLTGPMFSPLKNQFTMVWVSSQSFL